MNYKFLLFSFLFGLGALSYYLLHKWWLNVREQKKEAFYKQDTNLKKFQDWLIIIGFAIASIVYFFKAI